MARARGLLDIGSGDAWLASCLRERMNPAARAVCWDANYSAGDRASLAAVHPGIEFVAGRPSGRFDLLGPAVTRAITGVLTVEARISLALGRRGIALPGLSYWALCRHE